MKGKSKRELTILTKHEKRKKIQRSKLRGVLKVSKREYNPFEIDCESCECKVKCTWKVHIQTQQRKNNEGTKRKKEKKLSKMTVEEKDEYSIVKKLKKIWNKVRL